MLISNLEKKFEKNMYPPKYLEAKRGQNGQEFFYINVYYIFILHPLTSRHYQVIKIKAL
jgi:hypothetical protein